MIQGWQGKMLSQARWATFIQAIAQAIPICFMFPKGFIHDINMLLGGFWWGIQTGKNGFIENPGIFFVFQRWMEILAFEILRRLIWLFWPKKWWRLIHAEDSLSFKVFKARYFQSKSVKREEVVTRGATLRVGDGRRIHVWRDKWIPRLSTKCPNLHGDHDPTPMMVSSLIDDEKREWHKEMVFEMF